MAKSSSNVFLYDKAQVFLSKESGAKRYLDASASITRLSNEIESLSAQLDGFSFSDALENEEKFKQVNELVSNIKFVTDKVVSGEAQYKTLSSRLSLSSKALKFFSFAIEKVTFSYIKKLEATLNDVFFYVYRNPEKKVTLGLEDFRDKKVLRLAIDRMINGAEYREEIEEDGHSVSVVLGTVILIYFLVYNGLPRVLSFDESFSGLSDQTLDRFMPLLRVFVDQLGFKFLIISHDERLVKYVNKIYLAEGGVYKEQVLEKTNES